MKYTKDLMKAGNFSESIKTSSAFLNNNLFKDTKEEIELTFMLSVSYAKTGDAASSYKKLEEIPIEKIAQLDDEDQKEYAVGLLRTFALKVTNNQSGDIVKAPFRFSLAMKISEDEETLSEWNDLTNKIIGLQAAKGINLSLFESPIRNSLTINEQFTELVNLLEF